MGGANGDDDDDGYDDDDDDRPHDQNPRRGNMHFYALQIIF